MLLIDLKAELLNSMKARDAVKTDMLRFLLAAVRNVAIAKYGAGGEAKVTEADIEEVIKKQVKTHAESIEAFTKAGRMDLAQKEQAEYDLLAAFLPKPLTDEELRALLIPVAQQGGDFGPLMGRAMAVVKGQADGTRVSVMLRQLLEAKTQ